MNARVVPLGGVTEPRVYQGRPTGSREFTYVDISSIDNATKRIVEPKRLRTADAPSRARQHLRSRDVIVSMTRPNLNAVALVDEQMDGAIGSTGFDVLRATSDVTPQWIYYGVQSPQFVNAMCGLVQGALYPAVRPKDIRAFGIPVPPLDEQRRVIAEVEKQLTRLDAGVASLKRVQTELKRYRASVLKAACEGHLVPTNKKRWRNATFAELCHVQGGYAFKSSDYQSEGIPLIRISNLVNGEATIDFKTPRLPPTYVSHYSEFLLRTGDVLIAMSGATTGKMATFMLNEPALLNQRVGRFIVKADADATREYLALVVEQIARQVLRDAYGAAQPNISPKKIEAMNLSLPPISEQLAIVAEIERRLSVIEELATVASTELQRATRLRQSILQRVFVNGGYSVKSHNVEA
jgi:type I restriction enzyme S subunit